MILYVTRHAQVCPALAVQGIDCPVEDFNITELGQNQAALLGQHLQKLGFSGQIYSSPFRRTLQTSQIVADIIDTQINIAWQMREISAQADTFLHFKGMAPQECADLAPRVTPGQSLPDPWWIVREESMDEVARRVSPFIDEVLARGQDALLVGHGASVEASNRILLDKSGYKPYCSAPCINCSLSAYEYCGGVVKPLELYDTTFIPLLQRSENIRMQMEWGV